MTKIIDGKKRSEEILADIKEKIDINKLKPCLAIILSAVDEASKIYVNNKITAAKKVGIETRLISLSNNVTAEEILKELDKLNKDSFVNGIIIQLPLPSHIDSSKIIDAVDSKKDVDGFSPYNVGRLAAGIEGFFVPCTPLGVLDLIKQEDTNISGKNIVIIGRSNIVGKPLAQLLLKQDATVTICHSKTHNLKFHTLNADIVICAAGKEKYFDKSYFNDNSFVIDVGISREESGAICGDVDFDSINGFIKATTKVPGGVGPMTVASLMKNTLKAYFIQNEY
jgi:methylenetetrahydrofolate dehydrogenase (NADP+) / methenyltetrahydrofolate cyclohydrolase